MVVLVNLMELAIVQKDFLVKNVIKIILIKVIEILNHKSYHVKKILQHVRQILRNNITLLELNYF